MGDDGGHTAGAAARAAGVNLGVEAEDVVARVTQAAAHPDVAAVVIGGRAAQEVPGPPVTSQWS